MKAEILRLDPEFQRLVQVYLEACDRFSEADRALRDAEKAMAERRKSLIGPDPEE